MSVNNNNRKGIKKEGIEKNNVNHAYIGDKYKDLIDSIFRLRFSFRIYIKFKIKLRLRDRDLKLDLTSIANDYLEKKYINVEISKNLLKSVRCLQQNAQDNRSL